MKGFTLIETLIAVSILTVGIAGPLQLASRAVINSGESRNQVSAYYLASEALEVVRFIRDQNSFKSQVWTSGIPAECFTATKCVVDSFRPTGKLIACDPTTGCPPLQIITLTTPAIKLYRQGQPASANPVNAPYTRELQISLPDSTVPNDTGEITVTATIKWRTGDAIRSYVLKENLLDWK